MKGERAHGEVVADLVELQAGLRGEVHPPGADHVSVIESGVEVRVEEVTDRIGRLELRLEAVSDGLDRVEEAHRHPAGWRRFPQVNLCPPLLELTLDDEIAMLQTTIQRRLEDWA